MLREECLPSTEMASRALSDLSSSPLQPGTLLRLCTHLSSQRGGKCLTHAHPTALDGLGLCLQACLCVSNLTYSFKAQLTPSTRPSDSRCHLQLVRRDPSFLRLSIASPLHLDLGHRWICLASSYFLFLDFSFGGHPFLLQLSKRQQRAALGVGPSCPPALLVSV